MFDIAIVIEPDEERALRKLHGELPKIASDRPYERVGALVSILARLITKIERIQSAGIVIQAHQFLIPPKSSPRGNLSETAP